ncbi:MAG TPA: type IV pilus secretin PilQ [Candidatus Binatia bacterium]
MLCLNRRVQRIAQSRLVPALFLIVGIVQGAALSGCGPSTSKGPQVGQNQATAQTPTRSQPVNKEQPTPAGLLKLRDLSLVEERGQTTLSIKFSQPITEYRHFPLSQPSRIVIDVLSDAKQAPLSESFRIDTHWVGTLRLTANDAGIRLASDITAATVPPYVVTPEDGGLKIVIGLFNPDATGKRQAVLYRDGVRSDIRPAGQALSLKSSIEEGTSSLAGQPKSEDKKYTGQKISLEFKDADIKNVFRLLAEVSGNNIMVTDDVSRKVTLRLIELPWDQAMDLIVETNGLAKEEIGNVIRISTAGRFKSDRDALVAARRARDDLEPLQTVYYSINYAKVKELESKVKPLMSKRPDAALVIDERSNTIMLRDLQKTVEDVSTLVAKLDLRTAQVLIESNLVETTPTFSRALGTEIDAIFNGRIVTSSRFLAGSPFAGSANTVAPPFPVPSTGFRFGYTPANLNGFITAAENEGNAKIISRPSIVTLNNVPSTIKSERILRIALPSSTNIASGSGAAAGTAVATEKIPVGINLTVTPQVSSDGFVLMNIKVKSSSVANSSTVSGGTAGVIPFDELNREAEANVLVRDGETIVIGGILKDIDSDSQSGIPYLKDIPVFGWLFRNWRFQKDFEELVVFITPRIAAAGSENLPSAEQLWRNQMERTKAEAATETH